MAESRVIMDPAEPNKSRGFGFVSLALMPGGGGGGGDEDKDEGSAWIMKQLAEEVRLLMDGKDIDGRNVRVDHTIDKQQQGGGGGGGGGGMMRQQPPGLPYSSVHESGQAPVASFAGRGQYGDVLRAG